MGTPTLRSMLAEHVRLARTLRGLRIRFDRERCAGCWQCFDVCPVGCWARDTDWGAAVFDAPSRCIACGACVLQCPEDAIALE